MAYTYFDNNPIYYAHPPPPPRQHRQQFEDDYHYYNHPSRVHPQPPPPPPHSRMHDQYYYERQQQHYHNQVYPEYYQSLPKRKSSSRRRKLARSSSTGNLQREYEDLEPENDRDYNWYYEEQKHHVPHHLERRRRRNSSNNNNNNKDSIHQEMDAGVIIDLNSYADIDGEPMNELEVLALKNAAKNAATNGRTSQNEDKQKEQKEQKEQPLKETIPVAPVEPVNTTEEENISNMLETLTMTESNASTVVEPIVDDAKDQPAPSSPSTSPQQPTTTKKKRWPFAFLFRKPTINIAQQQHVEPTKSTSTPPTPVLTPDLFYNSNISSSTTTISPQHQITPHGFWAFRAPMTQAWYRFDNENQRKIHEHVSLPNGVLQVTDSHFGGGRVPMVVLPFQRICYYPTDVTLNQLACLELSFMPATIGGPLY